MQVNVNPRDLQKKLVFLYDYGESNYEESFAYLKDEKFLIEKEQKAIISNKWIKLTGLLEKEEFLSILLCFYPPLLKSLLIRVFKEALVIGKKCDSKTLFELVDTIPSFAGSILKYKDEELIENQEIKNFYQAVFGGYPDYLSILSKLKSIEKAEDREEEDIPEAGTTPNEAWVKGRKIASQVNLEKLENKNKYVLAPYRYLQADGEIASILSCPWKTFAVILFMIISEYRVEGLRGLSVRPEDKSNPFILQPLDLFIYNMEGREVKIGRIKDFTYEFCFTNGFYLFPDKKLDMDRVIFELLEDHKLSFKDEEYILNPDFNDFLYYRVNIIKNRSRKFRRDILKDYIEKQRKSL
jgi:hypothetical protein